MFVISSDVPWQTSFFLLYVTRASYKHPFPQLKQSPVLPRVIFTCPHPHLYLTHDFILRSVGQWSFLRGVGLPKLRMV